jgi:hypothetical protein
MIREQFDLIKTESIVSDLLDVFTQPNIIEQHVPLSNPFAEFKKPEKPVEPSYQDFEDLFGQNSNTKPEESKNGDNGEFFNF